MLRAHYNAVKTRLEAASVLSGKVDASVRVNDGEAVRANYVVLYPTGPSVLDDGRFTKLQQASSRATFLYDIRAVAVDADGCGLLTEAVYAQMIGATLTVTGRRCWPCRLDEAGRVEFDRTAGLFYCDSVIELISDPT